MHTPLLRGGRRDGEPRQRVPFSIQRRGTLASRSVASLPARLVLALAVGSSACGSTPGASPTTPHHTSVITPQALASCPEEDAWRSSLPELEQSVRESLQMTCVPGPGGRWELVLTELATDPLSEEEDGGTGVRLTGRFALGFVDAAGASTVGPSRRFEVLRAEDWWRSAIVRPQAHFDVDGDGREELFVWLGTADYEGTPVGEVFVMTMRGGAVLEDTRARVGVPIDEVRDVDADGRPDLVSCAPYCGTSPWGASPVPAGGPPNVFRSLPDGRFSNQDPVVLEQLRAACPARPARFLPPRPGEDGYSEALTAISCARIHGMSTDEIVHVIQAEQSAGACSSEGWAECGPLVEELARHAGLAPAHHLP